MDIALITSLVATVLNAIILAVLLTRRQEVDVAPLKKTFEDNFGAIQRFIRDESATSRKESRDGEKALRDELHSSLKNFGDSVDKRILEMSAALDKRISVMAVRNEERLEKIRETVEAKMESLQKDNSEKLEKMRATVDEKLHSTLERRLGESFKLVSDRLEMVHKGLGEMQTLAAGVGDLKRVLTNVKTRGTWGEVQLSSLLEQILTVEQYAVNVATRKGSSDRVEFAIRLPGKSAEVKQIWLPIDAKFPIKDYQRLIAAQEKADIAEVEAAQKALEARIKLEAKSISEKYIDPPNTTDFAVLYLPIEGLYAEVTQRLGLCEAIQRQYRVVVCGPNTIAALLNSLQMGFRTLAIEKRSSEVWSILGAVKQEFGKFGDLLDKTNDKLRQASKTIEDATRKSRTIERRLGKVQQLPDETHSPESLSERSGAATLHLFTDESENTARV
ncbi:MAG: DNA recombination protein RmuC [Patescibacteria group bacterium]|nr:DNA recombination protein RmuC [Patescibacteria group bacterium]